MFTGPGEILIAPETWGDIVPIVLDGSAVWKTGKHAFLAATSGITREYKSQGIGKGLCTSSSFPLSLFLLLRSFIFLSFSPARENQVDRREREREKKREQEEHSV